MRSIVLDFETFFDTKSGYTLKKMTTEEYIRDERFAAIALGYEIEDDEGKPATGWVSALKIKDFLEHFDWGNTAVLCHHASFDGLILSHHYGIRPDFLLCTMSMARAWWPDHGASLDAISRRFNMPLKTVPYSEFDGKHPDVYFSQSAIGTSQIDADLLATIGRGAAHDCQLTLDIFKHLMGEGFPSAELDIIDMTVKMFTDPKLIGDTQRLRALNREEIDAQDRLLAELQVSKDDLRSTAKFAKLLEDRGVEIEYKHGKNYSIPCFSSTDQFMKELKDDEDPTVAALCTARLQVKSNIRTTRSVRLGDASSRGPLPVYLNYFGATRTGRWSGGDATNWQNFPRSGELGECISADEEYSLIIADASQIECRILNYVAEQEDVIDAFRDGRDIYCEIASEIFGRAITKQDEVERFIGKRTELSCGYGIGAERLNMLLVNDGSNNMATNAVKGKDKVYGRMSKEKLAEAKRAVDIYRRRHPAVCRLWKEGDAVLETLRSKGTGSTWLKGVVRVDIGRLSLPNGTRLEFNLEFEPSTQSYWRTDRRGTTKLWGGALTGEVVQALAAVYLREVIINILNRTGLKPVWLRHDEAVYVVRECDIELDLKRIKDEFCRAPTWLPGIPLDCEAWASKNYAKEKKQ